MKKLKLEIYRDDNGIILEREAGLEPRIEDLVGCEDYKKIGEREIEIESEDPKPMKANVECDRILSHHPIGLYFDISDSVLKPFVGKRMRVMIEEIT